MPLTSPQLPYGLREVVLYPMDATETLGTGVPLPAAQTFSFSEAEEFTTLRGDDRDVAIRGQGPKIEWDLEAGGISQEAWQVLTGGQVADAGTTPTQTKTFTKKTTDARPYFKVVGRSVNDVDGDTLVEVMKCKVTDSLEGEFADGEFFITSCSGEGIGNASDDLYVITWRETAAVIPSVNNEVQEVIVDATGGTFTLTFNAETTGTIAWDATAATVQTALEGLTTPGPGDFSVTGVAGGPWSVEFIGTYADTDVTQMTTDDALLTGGSAAAVVITRNNGG